MGHYNFDLIGVMWYFGLLLGQKSWPTGSCNSCGMKLDSKWINPYLRKTEISPLIEVRLLSRLRTE